MNIILNSRAIYTGPVCVMAAPTWGAWAALAADPIKAQEFRRARAHARGLNIRKLDWRSAREAHGALSDMSQMVGPIAGTMGLDRDRIEITFAAEGPPDECPAALFRFRLSISANDVVPSSRDLLLALEAAQYGVEPAWEVLLSYSAIVVYAPTSEAVECVRAGYGAARVVGDIILQHWREWERRRWTFRRALGLMRRWFHVHRISTPAFYADNLSDADYTRVGQRIAGAIRVYSAGTRDPRATGGSVFKQAEYIAAYLRAVTHPTAYEARMRQRMALFITPRAIRRIRPISPGPCRSEDDDVAAAAGV